MIKHIVGGANNYGTLGNNLTTKSNIPVAVNNTGALSGKTVKKIYTSTSNTCLIASDNLAYCWGGNSNGTIGNNTTTESHTPQAVYTAGVLSGKMVTSIAMGIFHECLIASNSQVYCWGSNSVGNIGNNTTSSYVLVPTLSTGSLAGKTITSIASGYYGTCAIDSNSQYYCWGWNASGQFGYDSGNSNIISPTQVTPSGSMSGKTIKQISIGGYPNSCAIESDNLAHCWAYNTTTPTPIAVKSDGVLLGTTIKSISSGHYHVCAIASNNRIYCWGKNTDGQFGNNTKIDSTVPVIVAEP